MKTVSQLQADIKADIWPSGVPENLETSVGNHFQEAFADIAKWVDCERVNNANVVRFCATNYKSGLTVLAAPRGKIIRVFTIANDDFSDPVFYRPTLWPAPEAWARNLYLSPKPLVTDARKLPLGFDYANSANDSLYGRARTGIWSLYKGNIWIAPWIQSNELVVIEWDGIKEKWDDADPVNPEIMYRKAIKLYVQFAYERDYGQADRAAQFSRPDMQGWYDVARGDLMHECFERTKTAKPVDDFGLERSRLCNELLDDAVITDADGVIVADLGQSAVPSADFDTVGALVRSWGPNAITACGLGVYDDTIGNQFHDFISPYIGSKGAAGVRNGVWVAPSGSDWALDNFLSLQRFFQMPNNGRYYTVVLGDIQLFVLNTSQFEPDGLTAGSIQGQWLQGVLALSTAPWKVVKMERSPYGSIYQDSGLQWPFKAWGADVVLSCQARNYERLQVGDLAVINNGLGGTTPIEQVTAFTANTINIYARGFGAGKMTASALSFVYEFYDVQGNIVDTLAITK